MDSMAAWSFRRGCAWGAGTHQMPPFSRRSTDASVTDTEGSFARAASNELGVLAAQSGLQRTEGPPRPAARQRRRLLERRRK